ncbi:hypothetical protein ACH5AO_23465 [Streptomyces sp. NPDC018964]|uniref:hypothetical protein n=1 Tax=unclassified Streptomyces TaxID=2593676 RepID=UPI0037B2BFE3
MFRDADRSELAATVVSLTAEAAVVEARIKLLSDELAVVNSRIVSAYEALYRLHRPAMSADGAAAKRS